MSVSASSSAAIRRSRMPVRSRIHSSFVSTIFASSSFVTMRSGTWQPRPVIEIRGPLVRPITARTHRERQRPAHGELAVDGRLHLAAADRAAHGLDLALERQHVSGPHDALEANVVDAREERELAAILRLREHGDRAALRERLDHLHAGHDRVAGKVAGAVLVGDRLARDDALARNELEHLVDQQHRVAVRQHRLDRGLVHQHLGHAEAALARPLPAAVRVALRRADRQPGRRRDLLERDVEGVLQRRRPSPAPPAARRGSGRARVASPTRRARAPGRRRAPRACPRRAARCGAARPTAPARRPCTCSRPAGAARSRTATRRGTGRPAARASRATPGRRRGHPRGRAARAARSGARGRRAGHRELRGRRESPSLARRTRIGSDSRS